MKENIEGEELDVEVAKALGIRRILIGERAMTYNCPFDTGPSESECGDTFEPSTRWAHGGPIIEKEGIEIWRCSGSDGTYWVANVGGRKLDAAPQATGETPLIAAMRAFVRSKAANVKLTGGLTAEGEKNK